MKKRLSWLVLIAYLLIGTVAWAQPQLPPAPVSGIHVQDSAGVLTGETKARINNLSNQLVAKTKAQVVVVTVKSIQDTPLDEYSLAILRQWGVGDKTLNNGVVMLVAVSDRKSRIEVGYGLEGALPDAKTGRIQDEFMLPYFRQGDYDKGIWNGYLAIVNEVAKEYKLELKTDAKPVKQAPPAASQASWWDTLPWWAQLALVAGLIGLLLIDWIFFGGTFTFLILSLFRGGRGGGGGSGGGGYGGGSGGGGGSSRNW